MNWDKIFATTNISEAEIIKGMLHQNNIPVTLVNRQDSSYLNFGEIELYVPRQLKQLALQLMQNGWNN